LETKKKIKKYQEYVRVLDGRVDILKYR